LPRKDGLRSVLRHRRVEHSPGSARCANDWHRPVWTLHSRAERGGRSEIGLPFHAADAFAFVPEQLCDAAFTGIPALLRAGDERNRECYGGLSPASNPAAVLPGLFPNMAGVLSGISGVHGPPPPQRRPRDSVARVESQVNLTGGMLEQQWTYGITGGRREVRHSAVRLYLPHNWRICSPARLHGDRVFRQHPGRATRAAQPALHRSGQETGAMTFQHLMPSGN